jgi:UDP-N-acetylglucosamine diphosphorylase / glucose-1-phosphate thymidylyltransferase / UDP-N-acetylgalactosamine diphosphorylase / glucosamine-1-phosphate N-acetyltransferase / galactosamine-1-phosphate N-acetyltransferase
MTSVILFDDPAVRTQLLPFTFTRPVAGIRCGILTLAGKWGKWLDTVPGFLTESYLQDRYPASAAEEYVYVNGCLCPDSALVEQIQALPPGSLLRSLETDLLLAARTNDSDWTPNGPHSSLTEHTYAGSYVSITHLWDIYMENGGQIRADFDLLTSGRSSAPITDPYTNCYASDRIFLEEGAVVRAAVLNAEGGPIFIGRNAVVSEGAIVQGPFAMGEGSVLGQGAKIRPNTTLGPYCKASGEVNNAVLFGYSNKAHDGYLGNSVLGEWCNLGANTNNSNLKNDYTNVKLYSYATHSLEDTGQLFCGLFMGDYTKAGISTMFNTGTVVGVNVNVFGAGFQPKHIPSFTWGGQAEGFAPYRYEKALAVIQETCRRRQVDFADKREAIFRAVYELTNDRMSGGAAPAVKE